MVILAPGSTRKNLKPKVVPRLVALPVGDVLAVERLGFAQMVGQGRRLMGIRGGDWGALAHAGDSLV
jgi:hypothetical protein